MAILLNMRYTWNMLCKGISVSFIPNGKQQLILTRFMGNTSRNINRCESGCADSSFSEIKVKTKALIQCYSIYALRKKKSLQHCEVDLRSRLALTMPESYGLVFKVTVATS
jgi:hypothetical protein